MKTKGAVRVKASAAGTMKLNWAVYLKPVSIAITLACILMSVLLLLMQLVNKEIKSLQLSAPLEHVSENQIRNALRGVFPGGYISLSVEDVVERLTKFPMVARVQVEKIWPHTLKVVVYEEQPVAIWNQASMLSRQGDILPLALAQLQLPHLKGGEGESRVVMQHYQLFNRWGKRHQLSLQALHNTASGWQLMDAGDFQIWLDSAQAMRGLQQLENVLQQFKIERIRSIDMRYEQGFAVAWKDAFQPIVQG